MTPEHYRLMQVIEEQYSPQNFEDVIELLVGRLPPEQVQSLLFLLEINTPT